MSKCKHCQDGNAPVGETPTIFITRDMAIDAGDMGLEGQVYAKSEIEWGACPCCGGYGFENCPNCTKEDRISALEAENAALKADLAFDRQKVEETLPQLDAIKFMVDTLKAENARLKEANQWHPASEPPPEWKAVLLRVGATCYAGYHTGERYVISLLDSDEIPDVKCWYEWTIM